MMQEAKVAAQAAAVEAEGLACQQLEARRQWSVAAAATLLDWATARACSPESAWAWAAGTPEVLAEAPVVVALEEALAAEAAAVEALVRARAAWARAAAEFGSAAQATS